MRISFNTYNQTHYALIHITYQLYFKMINKICNKIQYKSEFVFQTAESRAFRKVFILFVISYQIARVLPSSLFFLPKSRTASQTENNPLFLIKFHGRCFNLSLFCLSLQQDWELTKGAMPWGNAVRRWAEMQDGQRILLTTPSVLVGFRVEVYRAEGTTQWYTAVIVGYNESTKVSPAK